MADKRKLFQNFAKKVSELKRAKHSENVTARPLKILKSKATGSNVVDKAIEKDLPNVDPPIIGRANVIEEQAESDQIQSHKLQHPDFVFENSELKAYIERGTHKQEKRFAMHDHMFYIKVEPKNESFPLLINMLDFLEVACNFLLDELKELYKQEDNNICYMTIYQEPLLNGNLMYKPFFLVFSDLMLSFKNFLKEKMVYK